MLPEWIFTILIILACLAAIGSLGVMAGAGTQRHRLAGIPALLASFGLLAWAWWGGTRVYVVTTTTDSQLDVSARRLFWSVSYAMSAGDVVTLREPDSGGLVVNDTPRTLSIVRHEYGKSLFGGLSPLAQSVEPSSVTRGPSKIDHFGPDDPPPRSVSVPRGSSSESLYHLTW